MGLKIQLWPRTLRARLLLLIIPLISLAFVVSGHLLVQRSKNAILAEKERYLFGITQFLQKSLELHGGYASLETKGRSGQNKLQILNEALAPVSEQVSSSFPGVGAGFYHRKLDAIVTYAPSSEVGKRVGEAIALDHPGRQVMEKAQAAIVSGQFVRGDIMNAMTPIVENGEAVGYIWANELIGNIDKEIAQMRNTVLLFSALALSSSLILVYFIIMRLTRDIGAIKKGLANIGNDLNQRLAPQDGETGDIVDSINSMAESLLASRQNERDLAEQALHLREETLRTAIEAIDEAFVLYDPNDQLVYCNEKYKEMLPQACDCLVLGKTFEEIVMCFSDNGVFSSTPDTRKDLAKAMLERHRSGDSDIEFLTSDGRWLRMIDRKASTGHTVGFRIDITALKRATEVAEASNCALESANAELAKQREQLEQQVLSRTMELATARAEAESANAVKTQFMANVSHEMRTPLHGILGLAEIGYRRMASQAFSSEDASRYFAKILESGQRMYKLVDSLLTLAQNAWVEQVGASGGQFQEIDIRAFVTEIAALMELRAEKRQQSFILDINSVNATLLGDPARLRQVFEHLIGNAFRYSPPEATISFCLTDTTLPSATGGGSVKAISFRVTDSGCGIPENEIQAIFEPFYQSTRTATGAGGTGLGLPLSRCIVQRHGGMISVKNNRDAGVVCEVILPVVH